MAPDDFVLVHAQYATAGDVGVEFLDRDRMRYDEGGRSIILTVETYVARDGAPDGVVVQRDDNPMWSDGAPLTAAEFEHIMENLRRAAVPLLTIFHRPTR